MPFTYLPCFQRGCFAAPSILQVGTKRCRDLCSWSNACTQSVP